MTKHAKIGIAVFVAIFAVCVAVLLTRAPKTRIRYGISPFQDTAMPKVAEGMGLYAREHLDVELVTVGWEDIVPAVASGGEPLDVAIGSINTMIPRLQQINVEGGGDVAFLYPLYAFKGASLMMHGDAEFKAFTDFLALYPNDRQRALREAMLQLKGKTIALPSGTPYEQMLVAGLRAAGMTQDKDITFHDVKLADALNAFGHSDIIGAGVTQRTEAMRTGARVFMDMESLGFAEVIGIVSTRRWAREHPAELNKLIDVWFESVTALFADMDKNSAHVLEYLRSTASTKYTVEEYKASLGFQLFPRSREEAAKTFLSPAGKYYWKNTWDVVNAYLLEKEKVPKPISYEYFMGESVPAGGR